MSQSEDEQGIWKNEALSDWEKKRLKKRVSAKKESKRYKIPRKAREEMNNVIQDTQTEVLVKTGVLKNGQRK